MYTNNEHVMKITVDDKKLKMEISIEDIVFLLATSPSNFNESKVKRGKQKEFAEWVASKLTDMEDCESNNCYWIEPFEKIFELALEGDTETEKGGLIKFT